MTAPVIQLNDLTKRFGDFTAVDGISLTVGKGEIFGFLGPNGAGKSTTIKMLCGILAPTDGTGSVAGFDILTGQDEIKNIVGYMSQRFSLYDDLTVSENLEFFGSIYGLERERLADRMREVSDMAGIGNSTGQLVKNLPAGTKQRLALGAAILHDPEMLFLDEPTAGVDPVMRKNFWDIIHGFSRNGKTVFVTTHYMDEAEHCDRIALISDGRIIALNSPGGLKKSFPYGIYELRTENFLDIFEGIASLPFVHEAAVFGRDVHIICEKHTSVKRKIGDYLKKREIKPFTITGIKPTLEDVFVTLVKK